MSYRNKITYKDGRKRTMYHTTSKESAKAWNENLAKNNTFGEVESVHLEHIADGPYDYSGNVTPIQTLYNSP